MVREVFKKICKKIGKFLIYCLNLAEYEKEIEKKIDTPNKLMNEWLFGTEGGKEDE